MKKGLSIIGIPLIALVMLPVAQAYSNEVVDPEGAVAPDEAITIEVAVEENEVVDERGIFKKIGDAWISYIICCVIQSIAVRPVVRLIPFPVDCI